jgi:hypothetical protein
MGVTDYIPGSFDDAAIEGISQLTGGLNEAAGNTLQQKGPLRGAYLEYEVPIKHGGSQNEKAKNLRLLMKEPIANWLGLQPLYPRYGTFGGDGNNTGKKYTKRAGYRFASYQVLLVPETEMTVPKATAAKQRSLGGNAQTEEQRIASFFIGVSAAVNVREFIQFLKNCKRQESIIGVVTPRKRKYQWGGIFKHAANG